MKRLPIFLVLALLVCVLQSSTTDGKNEIIPDLVQSSLEEHNISIGNSDYVFFWVGHHGYIWSLVVPENGNYFWVAGNTRNNDFRVDTVYANSSILTWGFNSLPLHLEKLERIERPWMITIYSGLTIHSAEKGVIFDWRENNGFSGPDSITFDKNLKSLLFFMHWIAYPDDVRKHFPSPL